MLSYVACEELPVISAHVNDGCARASQVARYLRMPEGLANHRVLREGLVKLTCKKLNGRS